LTPEFGQGRPRGMGSTLSWVIPLISDSCCWMWLIPLIYLFINFYFIHMCIQCLRHFSTLPPPSPLPPRPLPLPPTPLIPGRNYFALICNFVVERV
jgi:hypothetical protein